MSATSHCLDCGHPAEEFPEVNPLVDDLNRVIGILCPDCAIKRITLANASVDTSQVPATPAE